MKPYKIPVIVGLLFSVVFYSCDDLLDPKAETNLTEEFANVSYNNTLARSIVFILICQTAFLIWTVQ